MTLTRPLTRLERAILRAVVELGDDAFGVPVRHRTAQLLNKRDIAIGSLYACCNRLEEEGFIRSFEGVATAERGWHTKQYWRPVFDLTEVLKP